MRALARCRFQRSSNHPRQPAAASQYIRRADSRRHVQIQAAPSSDSSGAVEQTPGSASTPGIYHCPSVSMDICLLMRSFRCRFRSHRDPLLAPLRHPLRIATTPHPPRHPGWPVRRSLHHRLNPDPPLLSPPRATWNPLPLPTPHHHNPHHSSHRPQINVHLPRSPPPDGDNRLENLATKSPPSLDRQHPHPHP